MHVLAIDPRGVVSGFPRLRFVPGSAEDAIGDVSSVLRRRERPLVLVVDDEASIRLLCRVNLRLEGLDTVEAGNGEDALELARSERPDVILLDVMMPHVDGWQVAEELAQQEATSAIPIVFLSARAEPADHVRGYDLGAVGYVTKPFDPTSLGAILQNVLERVRRGERDEMRQERLRDLGGP